MFPRTRPRRTGRSVPNMSNCYCGMRPLRLIPAFTPYSSPYSYQYSSPMSVRPFDEYGAASDTFYSAERRAKSWGIPFFSQPDDTPEERDEIVAEPVAQSAAQGAQGAPQSGISRDKISAFVRDNLLKNHNIAYLPDYVEGALYENAVTALMGLLEGVITTSKIEVLGHVITFSIRPIDTPSEETETAPSS